MQIGNKAYKDSCWIDIPLFTMPQFVSTLSKSTSLLGYRSLKMYQKTASCLLFLVIYFLTHCFHFQKSWRGGGGGSSPLCPSPCYGPEQYELLCPLLLSLFPHFTPLVLHSLMANTSNKLFIPYFVGKALRSPLPGIVKLCLHSGHETGVPNGAAPQIIRSSG